MSYEVVIKFTDLRLYLQNRRVPIMPADIAAKTRYFGKQVSDESARKFFRGELSTTAVSFAAIRVTIEGWQEIRIDFSGSPYDTKAATGPGAEGRSPAK